MDSAVSEKVDGDTKQDAHLSVTNDQVNLAERAELMVKARRAFRRVPEVNKEKVKDIKRQIDNGSYSIPIEALAKRLIKHLGQLPPE